MVEVLVILDGASEPLGTHTSLEQARMPVLDELAQRGVLSRLQTVAPQLEAGSENAIPTLLGWSPPAAVDRALIEAAAHGIAHDGEVWRVDVAREDCGARVAARLGAHHLRGHRMLVCGPPPSDPDLHVWPRGVALPRTLDHNTVMIAARGAACGIATLMGARVIVPAGATGDTDTDLGAKASAALDAMHGAQRVVVHVGGADEAAHVRDQGAKIAFLERVDGELLAPLRDTPLRICVDHGCDPQTGLHVAGSVPHLLCGGGDTPGQRFTERCAAA